MARTAETLTRHPAPVAMPSSGGAAEASAGASAWRSAAGRALRPAGALLSGLLLAAAFPPVGLWPLAPVAVALLTLTLRGRRPLNGAGLGTLAGFAFFLPLLNWSRNAGVDAWIVLSLFQALYLGALGAALAGVSRLAGWPLWSAGLWVAEEAVRGRQPFGGFPWGRLAFSQGDSPLTGWAALGGAPLVTFVVALGGSVAAAAVLSLRSGRGSRRRVAAAAGAVAVTVVVALAGPLVVRTPAASGSVTVAVVQGNVPRLGLEAFSQREQVLRNHVAQTQRLADDVRAGTLPAPDLVVWPENASDIDPFQNPAAAELISSVTRAVDRPVLVGAVLRGPGRFLSNAGIVWDPVTGPGQRYIKQHPVPFGEYIPFRAQLTKVFGRVALVPRDFLAGNGPSVLQVGPARVGDVICFEVAYDSLVRNAVTAGGQLLVVQTNNASFGRRGESQQQLAMSQLRAVEHGRAVVVAATSGISAIIGPDGELRAQSEIFTADLLVQPVPLSDRLTIADRLGAAPEWALSALAAGAVVAAGARRLRRRRDDA